MSVTASVLAQSRVLDNPKFIAARQMINESQDAVVRDELRLTAEEDALFWPLYEEYKADTLPVRDRYIGLIADYMRQYETGILTNEFAKKMMDDYFDVKLDLIKIRKRYIKRFGKIMPMLKVARFYQLENKMAADVEAELALLVPLVEAN
jgi:hypothetical protein